MSEKFSERKYYNRDDLRELIAKASENVSRSKQLIATSQSIIEDSKLLIAGTEELMIMSLAERRTVERE